MFSTAVPLRAGRGRPAEIVASAQSCAAAPLPAPSGVQQAQPSSASEFLGERAGRRFLAGRRAARSAAVAASVALPAVASSQQVKDASSTESQSATARTDAQFMEHAKAGYNLIPIYRRIFSDQLTPVMAYRRLNPTDDPTVPSFLLESVVNGDQQGRYSFVGSDPAMEILARGDGVEVLRHPRGGSIQMEHMKADDPIKLVKEVQQEWNPVPAQSVGLPDAFCGGWSGYVSYDTVRYTEAESLPFENAPEDDRRLPDVNLGLYRKVVVFDNVSKLAYAILWVDMREHVSAEEALGTGKLELEELVAKLTKPTAADDGLPVGEVSLDLAGRRPGVMASNMTKEEFMKGFDGAMHHIGEGNSFQIVLSQRFERKTQATPLEIYRALRVVNPSPYMIYMQCRGCVLVASSPEILTRIHKREITNRPLAGTRWRGKTPEEDAALECELLADEKDRAEHVMLVDLGRNDVGKARPFPAPPCPGPAPPAPPRLLARPRLAIPSPLRPRPRPAR
eukprot:tig00000430_g644.t1